MGSKRKHNIPMTDCDEYDAFYKVPLCVFKNNTGLRKKQKAKYNKRQRAFEKMKDRNRINEEE